MYAVMFMFFSTPVEAATITDQARCYSAQESLRNTYQSLFDACPPAENDLQRSPRNQQERRMCRDHRELYTLQLKLKNLVCERPREKIA